MVKTRQILSTPAPGTTVPTHSYTDDQKSRLRALREYADTELLPKADSYHIWELRWLNRPDTIPRYMRAAKWNLDDAKKRLKSTLEWRRDYKPDLIPPDEVRIESETGKIIINGFDNDGRPIIYMRPGLENTETSPRQLRHLVWCLERAKDLMPPGQESVTIIIDYKSTTLRSSPSVSVGRKVVHLLQNHYVETLGRGVIINLPMLLNFFFKGISPFLDPVTRDKMRFNPNLLELVPKAHLDAEFGGDFEYEFERNSYWEQIVSVCKIAPDGTRVDDQRMPPDDAPHGDSVTAASLPVESLADADSIAREQAAEALSQGPEEILVAA
ncbi:CRAL-TRIO domain-containing protein [Trametes gibbosa]|nr:CRAL-TRIO domain-containing protein [Trametes gibbosa]